MPSLIYLLPFRLGMKNIQNLALLNLIDIEFGSKRSKYARFDKNKCIFRTMHVSHKFNETETVKK